MSIEIGSLVNSRLFDGVGKVLLIDEIVNTADISFFESPKSYHARKIKVAINELELASIREESLVFLFQPHKKIWKRARYGGERPNSQHLLIYRSKEYEVVSVQNLYVLNLESGDLIDSRAFLAEKVTDSPRFYNWRSNFFNAYLSQRISCRSISSVINSGIDLEPHQIAVVKRVLQDRNKKYLLADEVGLGKTIEAGMIIKELLMDSTSSKAIVLVPTPLVNQWKEELCDRLLLSDFIDNTLIVCSHDDALTVLNSTSPDIIVVDEAHLIAPMAWSASHLDQMHYAKIAESCSLSKACLLLSGTPVSGNEANFLSMLHLLSPSAYELTEDGLASFKKKVQEREYLGGIYSSLNPKNDNPSIEDSLDGLEGRFSDDIELKKHIDELRPFVDLLANESDVQRDELIQKFQKFIGENYKLHHRLLKSRRDEPHIACLFPGLDCNIVPIEWETDENWLSIEQSLESFRENYLTHCDNTKIINPQNYWSWIEAALVSPDYFAQKLQLALDNFVGELTSVEIEEFSYFLDIAKKEQLKKDNALLVRIKNWLNVNSNGQIVIFSGDIVVADNLFDFLSDNLDVELERHDLMTSPAFVTNENIKILICDQNGEDGLNLHGGKKLLIHYSMPLSITRLEQRIGRANRYSNRHAKPVENTVVLSDTNSFSTLWFNLLNNGVGVFNSSVASLQYLLENKLSTLPGLIVEHGNTVLTEIEKEFLGEKGWIALEKNKIRSQDQLNSMDDLIQSAKSFTEGIIEADEKAEAQTNLLDEWITKGLHFKKTRGEIEGTFKYQYVANETLMDVKTFEVNCSSGIDFSSSSYKEPITHLMAYDRAITSSSRSIYPYRYGQPFLDTIYHSLNNDIRGVSSAYIRTLKGVSKPTVCFCLEIFVEHVDCASSPERQREYDEIYPPKLFKIWLNENGQKVEDQRLINFLEQKYIPFDKNIESNYKDINLRTERWELVEEYYPQSLWSELVEQSFSKAYECLKSEITINQQSAVRVISSKAVILMEFG